MLKDLGGPLGSALATVSLLLCVGLFATVVLYVLTDRRRRHIGRMEAMPLDGDGDPSA